jgi:hypothetical protein
MAMSNHELRSRTARSPVVASLLDWWSRSGVAYSARVHDRTAGPPVVAAVVQVHRFTVCEPPRSGPGRPADTVYRKINEKETAAEALPEGVFCQHLL